MDHAGGAAALLVVGVVGFAGGENQTEFVEMVVWN